MQQSMGLQRVGPDRTTTKALVKELERRRDQGTDPARLRDAACMHVRVCVCTRVLCVCAGGGVWRRGVKFGLGSEGWFPSSPGERPVE